VPTPQDAHAVAPLVSAYVPKLHGMHTGDEFVEEYVPGTQSVHSAFMYGSLEYWPAKHGTHVSDIVSRVPAVHPPSGYRRLVKWLRHSEAYLPQENATWLPSE
jgi:hypothetical protein